MEHIILSYGELVGIGQLALAMMLGLLIGVERSVAGKEAGMRTFALVTVGSCLFIIVSELVGSRNDISATHSDPLRVASMVVSGVGFLGAGLIIFQKELKGLTTAAGLWVAAGIGMAVGFKLYLMAVFGTFLTLFIFVVLWYIEQFIESRVALPAPPSRFRLEEEEEEVIKKYD